MHSTLRFIKDWALVFAILLGIVGYFAFVNIPWFDGYHQLANDVISIVQPALIFMMLFISFCKVDLSDLRFRRWHLWLLLVQGLVFVALAMVLILWPDNAYRVEIEGAMLCLICPTATASPVITKKLGGEVAAITTYIMLINLLVAILIPALTPLVHRNPDMSVLRASMLILGKVFPLLLLPLVGAVLVRHLLPKVHQWLARMQELSFYLWLVALTLAIAVSVRSVVHSTVPMSTQLALVVISFVCCMAQFYVGRRIGKHHGDMITAQQSLGQKNTVLAIWMGYTFFSPVTAVVGGFYSVWHNLVNSYQLYKQKQSSATN